MLIRDRVNLDWGRSKTGFYYVPDKKGGRENETRIC